MKPRLNKFAREIMKQIDEHEFDMSAYRKDRNRFKDGKEVIATCNTALCFAGHTVAARRDRAKQLMRAHPSLYCWAGGDPNYTALAKHIWLEETGHTCSVMMAPGGTMLDGKYTSIYDDKRVFRRYLLTQPCATQPKP